MVPYILLFVTLSAFGVNADQPCAARQIKGQSVVCVCNTTYCDDITREVPAYGQYISYTTSEAGLRFDKANGEFNSNTTGNCEITLTLNPAVTFQSITGFGGAVTDSAAMNWKNLSDATLKRSLIDSYFSSKGLQYNMVRLPIGGTDFSTHAYAYNDLPRDDAALSNFSLAYEDHEFRIPMLKEILAASMEPVQIVSTTWSPPVWMKTNNRYTGFSRLKPEYYQTYADYHLKFLEKYAAEGISIWGLTTTNEPINGVFNLASFNSLGWTPGHMGQWIENNLGPTIRNSTFKDVKIITLDDQRASILLWFNLMIKEHPGALQYIDGVGVHYYTNKFIPASTLNLISKSYPDKFILATEACEGAMPWQFQKVVLGSWQRARSYIQDVLTDLNSNVVGWVDWNLCLNSQGGPNWVRNFVDSPIIVFPQDKEFVKQPMFYGLGHFSKFLPRGSKRIEVSQKKSFFASGVDHVAFITPYDTIVVVMYNNAGAKKVCIQLGNDVAHVVVPKRSVVTVELPYVQ